MIGLAPEVLINNIFGYNYIWVAIIFFKGVCAAITYYFLIGISQIKAGDFNDKICTILVFLLFTSLSIMYGDRISRPHLNPTIVLTAFCIILIFPKNILGNFIAGLIQCIPISHDPWIAPFSCIFIILLLWILNKKLLNIFIYLFGVLIAVFIAYYRIIYISPLNENYLEYLGKKEIYNIMLFYIDYLIALFKSPYIFLPALWIIIVSIATKQVNIALIFLLTLLTAIIPTAILGFVVQSYHYKIAASTFAVIVAIIISVRAYPFCYTYRFFNVKLNILFVFTLILFIAIPLSSEKSLFRNRLFERAIILERDYDGFVEMLRSKRHVESSCIVATNDIFLRPYALINGFNVIPKEGILMTYKSSESSDIDEVKDVAYLLALRRKFLNETIDSYSDIEMAKDLFMIRVHDKYSSSRSWMAHSVRSSSGYSDSEINQINKVGSFQAWPFMVPDELINRALKISAELSISKFQKIILVVKPPNQAAKVYSNCPN